VNYELQIERRAQKSLAKITPPERIRLISAIRQLAADPRPAGSKKLTGREAWRIRVGHYRVIYEIHENKLIVLGVSVGHRSSVYRQL